MAKEKFDLYQSITERIIERLDAGVVPWRKPWRSDGSDMPRNLNSKRPYRGINTFLLDMAGYESPYWVTFKGAVKAGKPWTPEAAAAYIERVNAERKAKADEKSAEFTTITEADLPETQGHVKGGEKGTVIVFWKQYERAPREGESPTHETDGRPMVRGFMLRYFRVWNVEQCENLIVPQHTTPADFDPIEEGQTIIDNMPEDMRNSVTHRGARAFYQPSTDKVTVPRPENFEPRESYYAVRFHEHAHQTGHSSRLNRDLTGSFGTDSYSKEELVAELTASFLCGVAGIDAPVIDNAAAYIASWKSKLTDDPKLIVQAAGQAQKAADFILGTTFQDAAAAE